MTEGRACESARWSKEPTKIEEEAEPKGKREDQDEVVVMLRRELKEKRQGREEAMRKQQEER